MDPGFTLEKIIEMQMQKYAEAISEVSNKATMELAIENVTIITEFLFILKVLNNAIKIIYLYVDIKINKTYMGKCHEIKS